MKKTMKKFIIDGIEQIRVLEVPVPEQIPENWALVKILAVPLCTEYKSWLDGSFYPGHEGAGEVVEINGDNCDIKVGDIVALMPGSPCHNCEICKSGNYIHCEHWIDYEGITGQAFDTHVQFMLKPTWLLAKVPEGITADMGALACCALGPTMGALDHMNSDAFDVILITGGGPVGLGGVVNAKFRGCKVILVEENQYRRKLAEELGADLVLAPNDTELLTKIKNFTNGLGVDGCIECSGTVKAQMLCLNSTRRLGSVALVGECSKSMQLESSEHFIRTGITLFGQWHYNMRLIPNIMQVIRESAVIGKLVTHTFPMSEIDDALRLDATHNTGKIIINPWK